MFLITWSSIFAIIASRDLSDSAPQLLFTIIAEETVNYGAGDNVNKANNKFFSREFIRIF